MINQKEIRSLDGHKFRSVQALLQSLADSHLSQQRNDHYGRGGYVEEFEAEIAAILGKEAAVFMPSGTMAQAIALRIWSDWSGIKNIAFHPTCHLEIAEYHGYRHLHGLNALLLGEPDRLFTIDEVKSVDVPLSSLLIELPQREIGGQLPTWEELQAVCTLAQERGIRLHLDGARLWECQPFYGRSYAEIVSAFDSVYVSFYKILGGLPGAALAGPASFITETKIWQRRQGGNLHQQSPSAIAAKLGLEEHLPRIPEYVENAAKIAAALHGFDWIRIVPKLPQTNMMHIYLQGDPAKLLAASQKIREEDKVVLLPWLNSVGKSELSIGSGAAEISLQEVRSLFHKLFDLAQF